MREPFGKSIFQPKQYAVKVTDKCTVGPMVMDFDKLNEYYNNDPDFTKLRDAVKKTIKENKWKEPWYADLYVEIQRQVMLYGDVVYPERLKEITDDKLLVYP